MRASRRNSDPDLPLADGAIDPDEIPALTDAQIASAVEHFNGVPVRRGRPALEHPKQQVTLRLDADIVAHYRSMGARWQSRINGALRTAAGLKGKG